MTATGTMAPSVKPMWRRVLFERPGKRALLFFIWPAMILSLIAAILVDIHTDVTLPWYSWALIVTLSDLVATYLAKRRNLSSTLRQLLRSPSVSPVRSGWAC